MANSCENCYTRFKSFKFLQELNFANFAIDSFQVILVGTNFRDIDLNSRNSQNLFPVKLDALEEVCIDYYPRWSKARL